MNLFGQSKVIGIISYLPDDTEIRFKRELLLEDLIEKCKQLFPKVPIVIIAQNWEHFEVEGCDVRYYDDKLGITGARKELRKVFLESNKDVLIMLDDDCMLKGESGKEYLKQIDKHPDCYYIFNKSLLKLFAISRSMFLKVNYIGISPEKGEGFEDRAFVGTLMRDYPDKAYQFVNTGITQESVSTKDPLSTWYSGQDLDSMLHKTEELVLDTSKKDC
jgi:hypothetical protein